MRTSVQAREEALARLAASEFSETKPTLIDSKTEEFPAGWVYFYQSALFLRTNDIRESLVGNAPLFVPRNGAEPEFISYHRPTAESAEAFSYCGNASAKPNAEVELKGWRAGARKVSATQTIRARSSLGLAAAHEAVEQCLAGQVIKIRTGSVSAARELVSNLEALGFLAGITYGA
jgi:ribosomal protein L7/L12